MSHRPVLDRLIYASHRSEIAGKVLRSVSPRLIPGIHYAFNGPVHEAVRKVGNLTTLDFILLRVYTFFGLPNAKLENKLRAIGSAFRKEAEMLELSLV